MTAALLVAGAVLALVGTRLTLLPLVAGAAAGLGGGMAPVGVWTAALAAGLVGLGRPTRSLAVPLVGAVGVLLAATATNAAVVLPAWSVGTAAAVLSAPGGRRGRRWGQGLLVADLPVVAAVVWTALGEGFVSWPGTLDGPGAGLLLGAAALRVPLSGGPDGGPAEPGLLVVRTQAVALGVVALSGQGPDPATAMVGLGALAVGLGALAARDEVADVVQEAGLVGIALGGSALGWEPSGWVWGALAAGTLNHWSRVRVSAPGGRWAWLEGLVVRGGGLGAPLLVAGGALVAGAATRGGALAGVVLVGVIGGLGVRQARARRRPGTGSFPSPARAVLLVMALAAGVWGPLLALPRPPAGGSSVWPPAWAVGVLAVGVLAGALTSDRLGPARARPGAGVALELRLPRVPFSQAAARVKGGIRGGLAVLGAGAVGVWILGFLRGFL